MFSVGPDSVRISSTGAQHEYNGAQNSVDTGSISGRAGEDLYLECVSAGGNPAPKLSWIVADKPMRTKQTQENTKTEDGSWRAVSRLILPVSRDDHRAKVMCIAEHDALDQNLVAVQSLDIMFPPRAVASADKTGVLGEGETIVLSCTAESNPPAAITWRRPGGNVLTTKPSFTIQSVGKESAGRYECVAENVLGLSQPAPVDVEVQCKYLFALIHQGNFLLAIY